MVFVHRQSMVHHFIGIGSGHDEILASNRYSRGAKSTARVLYQPTFPCAQKGQNMISQNTLTLANVSILLVRRLMHLQLWYNHIHELCRSFCQNIVSFFELSKTRTLSILQGPPGLEDSWSEKVMVYTLPQMYQSIQFGNKKCMFQKKLLVSYKAGETSYKRL